MSGTYVVEDNAGGLYMAGESADGEAIAYDLGSGTQGLGVDEVVDAWHQGMSRWAHDGWQDIGEVPTVWVDTIAEYDGAVATLHVGRMGAAGLAYFGIVS